MRRWSGVVLALCAACTGAADPALQLPPCAQEVTSALTFGPVARQDDGREAVMLRLRAGQRPPALLAQASAFNRGRGFSLRVTPAERAALLEDPAVEQLEEDRPVAALAFQPVRQGSAGEYTAALDQVQAPAVWDANRDGALDLSAATGSGRRVCIVDSGLDREHPELKLPIAGGIDLVDNDDDYSDRSGEQVGGGHGTHVAGLVAAQLASAGVPGAGVDPGGTVGIAPGAELLIARALDVNGRGSASRVIRALEWCRAQGAHVITLSLGAGVPSAMEEEAFIAAARDGILSFAATGNAGEELPMGFPAGYASVIPVGAVDEELALAPFSQTGFSLGGMAGAPVRRGLVAPGVNVLSTVLVGSNVAVTLEVAGVASEAILLFPARGSARRREGPVRDCGAGEDLRSCAQATCEGFFAYLGLGAGLNPRISLGQRVRTLELQGASVVLVGIEDLEAFLAMAPDDAVVSTVPAVMLEDEAVQRVRGQLGAQAALRFTTSDYARLTGTSSATPQVAAVAALVWSARPELSACQVREVLFSGAKDLGPQGFDARFGYGLVQARASVDAAAPPPCSL